MRSERLELIPATLELCGAERSGPEAMARMLDARIPTSWPPPVFEPEDLERLRQQLEANPDTGDWTLHYLVLSEKPDSRALVGVAGYVGPPTAERGVEIGYAIAEEHQRRGYATEAVLALVTRAFLDERVDVVAATTYATLVPSIGVLTKAGFTHVDSDPGTGLLRFERRRDDRVPEPAVAGISP